MSMIDILGELRREKKCTKLNEIQPMRACCPYYHLTTTIASLDHHCSHPHYRSVSRPLQSLPAAIERPSRQTGMIHSLPYRSAAGYPRLVAKPQGRTAPMIYCCTPYSPGVRRESHQTGSDALAECVLPRHSVSAVLPNLEVEVVAKSVLAPLSPADPSCGPSCVHRKRR